MSNKMKHPCFGYYGILFCMSNPNTYRVYDLHHHFHQVLAICFVLSVRYLKTDREASHQASVKQHKASCQAAKASVKHIPSICQEIPN